MADGNMPEVTVIDPRFNDKSIYTGWSQPNESKEVTFKVRVGSRAAASRQRHGAPAVDPRGAATARFTIR